MRAKGDRIEEGVPRPTLPPHTDLENWRVHLWRVHGRRPNFFWDFLFTIAWTTLRKRSKNMIFVNTIEVYNLKKRACGGLHSQRCSTCNVTHPQHHQSHHQRRAGRFRVHTHASTQLRLLKNVFKQLKTLAKLRLQDISCMWHSQSSCDNSVLLLHLYGILVTSVQAQSLGSTDRRTCSEKKMG